MFVKYEWDEIDTNSEEFYNHCFPLHTFNNFNYFAMGQYQFPFSFKLDSSLPGSFNKSWKVDGLDNHAITEYKISAGMRQ